MYQYNPKNKENAQSLRKNMTPQEKHLWYDFLKKLPFPVKRQYCLSTYIVDFYIPEKKIVIEIDGSQHGKEDIWNSDRKRDSELNEMGITVLRYTNRDIDRHFDGVCRYLQHLFDIDTDSE